MRKYQPICSSVGESYGKSPHPENDWGVFVALSYLMQLLHSAIYFPDGLKICSIQSIVYCSRRKIHGSLKPVLEEKLKFGQK